ncbi:MAG TPA: serine/threonine-protein kinase [Kofleriaceae bacterium]|nr:serine/threonine-protein kinase [Kofleriaceae bacterium]
MGDAPAVEREDDDDDAGTAAPTAHALPAHAHARRAAALSTPPPTASAGSTPGPQVSQQIAMATLREEELDTARHMIRVGRGLGLAAAMTLPFVGGSQLLRIALAATILLAVIIGLLVEHRLDRPGQSVEKVLLKLAVSVGPAVYMSALYFGVLSAVQLFPALILYFFARRESFKSALALFLANAIVQAAMAIALIAGIVEDPGLVSAQLPPIVVAIGHILLQVGFLAAFLLGRGSYKASREAIAKMQNAMMLAAQREALLHEARQDLDRALAIDAAGRFTDHTFGGYRLGHVIGRGGMGEVYEAFHIDSGENAAVKLLAHRELGNPASRERFVREVATVQKLSSPHVVRVLTASDQRDEIPYLVMERLRGEDLAHHLRSGKMPPSTLLEMLHQVGSAVEEAWAKGIVHRDLKPQNLYLADATGRPTWKVLDFGVAALDEHSGTLTQGKVVGTPAYMAPEQARGERVDHRADVYALCAIAYRWLTGRPVVGGKDLHNALYQTVHVMPQQPSTLAELHPDVDAVLAIGLCKEPSERWQTVGELRVALEVAIAGQLDPRARRRAADVLGKHPWGAVRG